VVNDDSYDISWGTGESYTCSVNKLRSRENFFIVHRIKTIGSKIYSLRLKRNENQHGRITFTFPIGTCDPSQFLNLRYELAGGIGGSVQLTPINKTNISSVYWKEIINKSSN
jgi:hypothetical protein